MKQLSIEEKAKAYDKALEKARQLCAYPTTRPFIGDLQDLFPELKESEDEKIRKELLNHLKEASYGKTLVVSTLDYKRWADWLEKQGEQKSNKELTFKALPRLLDMIEPTDKAKAYCQKLIDSLENEGYTVDAKIVGECLKSMNGEKVAMATMDGQKPSNVEDFNNIDPYFGKPVGKSALEAIKEEKHDNANKVEPKFKAGDFIVNDYCMGRIVEITNDAYLLDTEQGIPFSCEHNAHLWTIQDAKDGDVLVGNCCGTIICKIYNEYETQSYCRFDGNRFISQEEIGWDANAFKPATKEQRDLLFQKMKEAGYKWNASEKKLEKVEQKPVDMVEHKRMTKLEGKLSSLVVNAVHKYCEMNNLESPHFVGLILGDKIAKNWSKEILESAKKELELVEQKPAEWSEEDETMITDLSVIVHTYFSEISGIPFKYDLSEDKIRTWLKSLRPQKQWKPSERDLGSLTDAIIHYGGIGIKPNGLKELLEQLKKLREE